MIFGKLLSFLSLTLFLSPMAMAQAAAPKQPGALEMFLPFIFIFVIFYFLIIRPQAKKQKQHQQFVTELKKGDEVITASGILGTIEGITDRFVTLQVDEGVRLRVLRTQVAASQSSILNPEGKK